jgi:hypothetical protein
MPLIEPKKRHPSKNTTGGAILIQLFKKCQYLCDKLNYSGHTFTLIINSLTTLPIRPTPREVPGVCSEEKAVAHGAA